MAIDNLEIWRYMTFIIVPMYLIEMTIRRISGSDSDSYKNRFKKARIFLKFQRIVNFRIRIADFNNIFL